MTTGESYGISSRAHLARAERQLGVGSPESLFYAALQVRCGVEARLQEHLEPHEHIPLGRRTDWRVGNLHRTAESAFGERFALVRVRSRDRSRVIATFLYTPVSSRLKDLASRLGDYLHVPKKYHDPADPYWADFRAVLDEAIHLLREATAGTLLGPPIREIGTQTMSLPVEQLPDANGVNIDPMRELKGQDVILEVKYFSTLAEARADAA